MKLMFIEGLLLKKILPILLILSVVFDIVGYIAVFKTLQGRIRAEVRQTILTGNESGKFDKIKLRVDDPAYRRLNSTEFTYKGRLYDIVREERRGADISFICLDDDEEERLYKALSNYVMNEISGGKSNNAKALKYLHLFSFDAVFPGGFTRFPSQFELAAFPRINDSFSSRNYSPEEPPPEILV